jgi:16S rRNA G1207 methylase RsmC
MNATRLTRWHVGPPPAGPRFDEGMVAFSAAELERALPAAAVGFHSALSLPQERSPDVHVHVPVYRGMSLIPVLSWLVARLGAEGGTATWYADRQQGPDSIRRLLEGLGWELDRERRGRTVQLSGAIPPEAVAPPPRRFQATLAGRPVELFADYGVFSPDHIDDGTALLLEVALRTPRVDRVADVGTGYGPLAVGLLLGGVAAAAVGTDTDCIALWLAGENARACGVPLTLACTSDPAAIEPTPLTVCNVPTHLDRVQTERFMAALAGRARRGRLLAVVHASLQARYTRHLEAAGLRVDAYLGASHVVLETAGG